MGINRKRPRHNAAFFIAVYSPNASLSSSSVMEETKSEGFSELPYFTVMRYMPSAVSVSA